jgi:hypothetical protein
VQAVLDLQRELAGERLLADGDAKQALVELEAVHGLPKTLLADAFLAAGQHEKAIEMLEAQVKEHPRRFATTARLCIALAASSKPEHSQRRGELLQQLRDARSRSARRPVGVSERSREATSPTPTALGPASTS